MPFLLDTNHCIQLLKGRCPPLANRLVAPPDLAPHLQHVAQPARIEGLLLEDWTR